jgi:putative proteasome-type protease
MTYCVGLQIDRGLVFMSDTRTNAGMDSISSFRKMHVWEEPGERVIVLMSAGNLATTQAVVSLLEERSKAVPDRHSTVMETPSMYQTARLVGDTVKEVIAGSAPAGQNADAFGASFILGGQIRGSEPRLFMIYPEGKSNLSVGLPLDLLFYGRDSFRVSLRKRIGQDDTYYRTVSDGWSAALKAAFQQLPDFPDEAP